MSLRAFRKKEKLTKTQLSDLTSISMRTIDDYETGKRDINGAKIKTLLKLCKALSCRLEDILTDEETLDLLQEVEKPQ